jgi:hypothetical protein
VGARSRPFRASTKPTQISRHDVYIINLHLSTGAEGQALDKGQLLCNTLTGSGRKWAPNLISRVPAAGWAARDLWSGVRPSRPPLAFSLMSAPLVLIASCELWVPLNKHHSRLERPLALTLDPARALPASPSSAAATATRQTPVVA